MNKIILVLLIASVGISSLVLNFYLWSEKKALTKALDEAAEYANELKRDIQAQAEILTLREQKINQLARDKNALSKKLKEAAEHDEQTKAWANEYVPSSVSSLLKQSDKPADNTRNAAPSVP